MLLTDNHEELCKVLSSFVMETCKEDGKEYTPKSIYLMIAGLQRAMRQHKGRSSSFNIFSDSRFELFHNICDHKFRTLHQQGIGAKSKHANALTDEEANKYLCLRGGNEHRLLRFSQFIRETATADGKERACYIYTEQGSKNHSGGMGQLHLDNKVVHHFEVPEEGSRDYVHILDQYFEKVPREAIEKDNFYVRSLSSIVEGKPWFNSVPIGKNKLSSMVKDMCAAGSIDSNKTNHSLRSFGVTTMFKKSVPQKLIQERSGHRSLTALRVYEKSKNEQLLETSRLLCDGDVKDDDRNEDESKDGPKVNPAMFSGCSFSNCTFKLD
ncbi:PREDICTED: uncharacterized protein LOC105313923 [Amphimedon queenslandica]|uniref:DUF3504 domain-containing protein n=1 Tax=Amphimedon queenslandica TaxID=400682 RepID=A0AAN0IP41_AMPQE|nr:PREDICTED: uncharacterized protein LOC105313923 [Amphimedon queenslandica]|eukprot:XP_011406040.1 PREDICTED: uncharacterized protein LOC105313923 [Amphimedon queenslandica]